MYIRAYGADFYDGPTIFTRYGKKGISILVPDRNEVKFKLQYEMHMMYV